MKQGKNKRETFTHAIIRWAAATRCYSLEESWIDQELWRRKWKWPKTKTHTITFCGRAYFPNSQTHHSSKCTGHHYDATCHQRQSVATRSWKWEWRSCFATFCLSQSSRRKISFWWRWRKLWQSGGGSIGSWGSLPFETDDTFVLAPLADQASNLNLYKDCDCDHWRSSSNNCRPKPCP